MWWIISKCCFLLCLQVDANSFLLLSELSSGWQIMINFSNNHWLHRLVYIVWLFSIWLSIGQLIIFKVQMCLPSSVASLCFEFLKELVWFEYLVLKVLAVSTTCFLFHVVFSSNRGLVNYTFCLAFSGKWAGIFLPAKSKASSWVVLNFFVKHIFVMRWDDVLHVGLAAKV